MALMPTSCGLSMLRRNAMVVVVDGGVEVKSGVATGGMR
jgi:hypothetical protein